MTAIPSDTPQENPRVSTSLDTFSRWLLVIALLIVASVFLAYLLLALPANDDFVRAVQPWKQGYWSYFKWQYLNWQGRWVSFGIESGSLSHRDMIKFYPALIGAVAVVNFLGIFVVCRWFTSQASRWFSLACAMGLSAVLWAQMPSVAEAVYWFTGTIENAMSLALAGMLLVGLISMRASAAWMVFASGFAIVICGLHESYGAMLCIALATGTLAAYLMGSKNRLAWLVVLIAAVVGLGIVAGAPGNRARLKSDGPKHARHLVEILKLAATQFWISSRSWIFDPKLLAASLWVAFSPRLESARPLWPNASRVPWRILLPIAWLGMLAVGFFLPSYAFDALMPPRTLSGNFIVFAVGWLLIVFVWTRRVDSRDHISLGSHSLRSIGCSALARLVLAMGLILTGNTIDALHDLATRHVFTWRSSVESRFATLRRNRDIDVVVPRLAPQTRLLFNGEIGTDPKGDYRNWSLADFFHAKRVRVLPLPVKSPTTAPEAPAAGE